MILCSAQQDGVPISQQLGFQEKMNDVLRIAVAEAGLQAAAHVKSTKGLRLRHFAKLEVRRFIPEAGLLAWWPCDGQRYHSRRRHYYIPTYQPRSPPSADPTCTTPADFTTTCDLTPIIIHAFLDPTEQTPTSASRPNHGPTYAARWSPRRRAVRTVQACASGLVATPCRIYTTRYTDRLKVNPPWERVRSCSAL